MLDERLHNDLAGISLIPFSTHICALLLLGGRAESETFEKWSWLRVPAGGKVSMTSAAGCEVFVKEGEWRPLVSEEP